MTKARMSALQRRQGAWRARFAATAEGVGRAPARDGVGGGAPPKRGRRALALRLVAVAGAVGDGAAVGRRRSKLADQGDQIRARRRREVLVVDRGCDGHARATRLEVNAVSRGVRAGR